MPDFTPAEIQDAIANPRPGDVWEKDGSERKLISTGFQGLQFTYVFCRGSRQRKLRCWIRSWREWTRNATLVRRGA